MNSIPFQTPLVSVQWLNDNIDLPELIVLDATINKSIDTSSVRIPHARFFDIKQKFSDVSAPFPSTLPSKEQFEQEAQNLGINKNSIVVVYDDKGIYSSARAWWLFKTFGFKTVAVLDGGLPEWKVQGYKIESYSTAIFEKGNFKADFNSHLMTDFNGVGEFSKNSDALIIDARSSKRFQCKVDEPREGLRRGTIPNSVNLPYTNLFDGYTLKPVNELKIILDHIIKKQTTLVFSCGSGITACILALAATLCDYKNLVVYDGSWTEYGTLT